MLPPPRTRVRTGPQGTVDSLEPRVLSPFNAISQAHRRGGEEAFEDLTGNHRPQPTIQPVTRQMTGEHLPRRRGTWCSTQLNTIRAHGIPLTVVRVSPASSPGPAWTLLQGPRQATDPGSWIALAARPPAREHPSRQAGRWHPAGRP